MNVTVNGQRRAVAEGATVATLLDELDTPGGSLPGGSPAGSQPQHARRAPDPRPGPPGVAVALNGEVVPSGRWRQAELHDGDSVEVLAAAQGG